MDFPYLPAEVDFKFPPTDLAEDGIVAFGGNLSPGMLLSAYRRGIFPWYNDDDEPILWHSPDPRFVLFPEQLHISKKFRSFLKKQSWTIALDRHFDQVITCCAKQKRPGQLGTWITDNMQEAYKELHRLGFAHSCEVYENGVFIGGLYGVNLGKVFFGESMVSLKSQASRYAFIKFVQYFTQQGLALIDCQQKSEYLGSLGAEELPRASFEQLLNTYIQDQDWRGNWALKFPDFG